MGLRINTNISSIASQRSLRKVAKDLGDNFRKLSTGERITRAGDDAAGLAISESFRNKIRSSRQAKRNANDAISLIQTAEASLSEISNIVIRLRELSMQSSSDTIGDTERGFADLEFQQLKEEITRISKSTEFNGTYLLNGSTGMLDFQIGIHNDPILDRMRYDGSKANTTTEYLGLASESIATKEGAQLSLQKLDNALVEVNGMRAEMGALQNRLSSTINNLSVSDENMSAANSRIRDVDMASETADMAKNSILSKAGTSVLLQANQQPTFVLKLLG